MKFYISGSWNRRDEFKDYAKQLEAITDLGLECCASWLTDDTYAERDHDLTDEEMRHIAAQDLDDVADAHLFIAMMEPAGSTNTRGGRHVEYGAFLAQCTYAPFTKRMVIVGEPENLFYAAPAGAQRATFDDLLAELKG